MALGSFDYRGQFLFALLVSEVLLTYGAIVVRDHTGLSAGSGFGFHLGQLVALGSFDYRGQFLFALLVSEILLTNGAAVVFHIAVAGAGGRLCLHLGHGMTLCRNDRLILRRLHTAIFSNDFYHKAIIAGPVFYTAILYTGCILSVNVRGIVMAGRYGHLFQCSFGGQRFIGKDFFAAAGFAVPIFLIAILGTSRSSRFHMDNLVARSLNHGVRQRNLFGGLFVRKQLTTDGTGIIIRVAVSHASFLDCAGLIQVVVMICPNAEQTVACCSCEVFVSGKCLDCFLVFSGNINHILQRSEVADVVIGCDLTSNINSNTGVYSRLFGHIQIGNHNRILSAGGVFRIGCDQFRLFVHIHCNIIVLNDDRTKSVAVIPSVTSQRRVLDLHNGANRTYRAIRRLQIQGTVATNSRGILDSELHRVKGNNTISHAAGINMAVIQINNHIAGGSRITANCQHLCATLGCGKRYIVQVQGNAADAGLDATTAGICIGNGQIVNGCIRKDPNQSLNGRGSQFEAIAVDSNIFFNNMLGSQCLILQDLNCIAILSCIDSRLQCCVLRIADGRHTRDIVYTSHCSAGRSLYYPVNRVTGLRIRSRGIKAHKSTAMDLESTSQAIMGVQRPLRNFTFKCTAMNGDRAAVFDIDQVIMIVIGIYIYFTALIGICTAVDDHLTAVSPNRHAVIIISLTVNRSVTVDGQLTSGYHMEYAVSLCIAGAGKCLSVQIQNDSLINLDCAVSDVNIRTQDDSSALSNSVSQLSRVCYRVSRGSLCHSGKHQQHRKQRHRQHSRKNVSYIFLHDNTPITLLITILYTHSQKKSIRHPLQIIRFLIENNKICSPLLDF